MRSFRFAVGTFLLTAGLMTIPLSAAAHPLETGCPEGWPIKSVAEMVPRGYYLLPEWDAAGNNDGFLCARAIPNALCTLDPCPVPQLYLWQDNNLPYGRTKGT